MSGAVQSRSPLGLHGSVKRMTADGIDVPQALNAAPNKLG